MNNIRLTIGIPILNGAHYLNDLLESLSSAMEHTTISYEIVVVDDGSTENLLSVVEKFDKLPIVFIKHPENRGTAYATNTIIENMQGDYLLRLDADIIVNKDAIEGMYQYLSKHIGVGAVACKLIGVKGDDQSTIVLTFKDPYQWVWDYAIWIMKIVKKLFTRLDTIHVPTQIAYCGTGAIMIRKEAIEAAGLFDADIQFFMEDADYTWRITQAAWKIMYHPDYKMVHVGGHSGVLYIHMRPNSLTNLHKFYYKHAPGRHNQVVLDISILAGTIISTALLLLALPLAIVPKFRTVLSRAAHSYKSVYMWYWKNWVGGTQKV